MQDAAAREDARREAVRVTNRAGSSPFVLLCDHASNFVPEQYGTLGLDAVELTRHIAWDPGALPVARRMAQVLDAPLVESCVSRLMIDCNRPLDAPDLIWTVSETTRIPGNENLSAAERERRVAMSWRPFHTAIEGLVEERLAAGRETRLVSVHSFTPVYAGRARPWHVGILHDEDMRLARPMLEALRGQGDIVTGDNQPYSPADRVYFTLERHGRSRGLPCAMIEIRNDEIAEEAAQRGWADRLAKILSEIELAPGSIGRGGLGNPAEAGQLTRRGH